MRKTPNTSSDNVTMLRVSKEFADYVHRVCRRRVASLSEFEHLGLRLAHNLEIPPEDAFDFLGHFTLDQLRGDS